MLQLLEVNAFDEYFNPGKAAAIVYNEAILKAKLQIQPALQTYVPEGKAAGFDELQSRAGGSLAFAQFRQWNFQVFNSNSALEDTKAGLEFFDWLLGDQDNIDIWLMGIDGVNYKKLDNMRYEDLPDVDGTTNYRRRWYVAGVPGRFERVPADASDEFLDVLEYITNPEYHMPNPLELYEPDRKVVETELAQMDAASKEAVLPLKAGQLDPAAGHRCLQGRTRRRRTPGGQGCVPGAVGHLDRGEPGDLRRAARTRHRPSRLSGRLGHTPTGWSPASSHHSRSLVDLGNAIPTDQAGISQSGMPAFLYNGISSPPCGW